MHTRARRGGRNGARTSFLSSARVALPLDKSSRSTRTRGTNRAPSPAGRGCFAALGKMTMPVVCKSVSRRRRNASPFPMVSMRKNTTTMAIRMRYTLVDLGLLLLPTAAVPLLSLPAPPCPPLLLSIPTLLPSECPPFAFPAPIWCLPGRFSAAPSFHELPHKCAFTAPSSSIPFAGSHLPTPQKSLRNPQNPSKTLINCVHWIAQHRRLVLHCIRRAKPPKTLSKITQNSAKSIQNRRKSTQ
jgi:hypothetical protein